MRLLLARLIADRTGSNALEYGLILALASLSIILGAASIGNQFDAMFRSMASVFASITANLNL
jgi:Flp pilus assembly pilin Flp